jgi:hypothetical protein
MEFGVALDERGERIDPFRHGRDRDEAVVGAGHSLPRQRPGRVPTLDQRQSKLR